jgi:hypothetical protein
MRPRGLRTDCRFEGVPQINYSLLSFSRLQGMTTRFTGQDTGIALGFLPLSAITARRDDQNFRF